MSTDLRSIVPRQNPGCDVRALPLTAQEGFVLSRVDGFTNASDIGAMTGFGDGVLPMLQRLASLGALLGVPGVPVPAPPPKTSSPPPSKRPSSRPPARISSVKPTSVAASVIPPPPTSIELLLLYDPEELDEVVDLDLEKKRRILELFYRLDSLTHYGVLGVDPSADKKVIKSAYYQLAPEFHPDKYFRKNLGKFKSKMEAVFKRLTEAQEVLSRNATRAEYDAYLEDRKRVAAIERLLSGEDEPPVSDRQPPPVVTEQPPPPPAPAPPQAPVIAPLSETRIAIGEAPRSVDDDRLRRQALAAKLSSSRHPTSRSKLPVAGNAASQAETKPSGIGAAAAREVLMKMQAQKSADDHKSQITRLISSAEEAVARGDAIGAANAYRLASTIRPDDPALEAAQRTWTEKAAATLAPTYLKQADYESKEAKWPEAARSYGRAVQGMPNDARVLHLSASALLQAGGDLHQAAEHAKRAVALAPDKLEYRLTLAEVYLAANLPKNAKREAEAAAKIDAQDENVRAMLKRIS